MKTQVVVRPDTRAHTVSRYLYSQFAEHIGRCIAEAMWVGPESDIPNDDGLRTDVVQALAALKLPALRWPGGCFADDYHWMDGIGPRDKRPTRSNLWWKSIETNSFGTDEFMRLCAALGTEPYICVNVGSGTPAEARAWVEYCTGTLDTTLTRMRADNGHADPYKVPFWGIGNENWGCGGFMRPEQYADHYRQFATFVRTAAAGTDAKLIACGSNHGMADWDERFMKSLGGASRLVDLLSIHQYTWIEHSLEYTDEQYVEAMTHVQTMVDQIALASRASEGKVPVVLDEWGTWFRNGRLEEGFWQQSTMLDAVFAAASFNAFHAIPELFMTNMAQTANVLQALVLTDGPRMLRTPTYHVWDLYMPHRDATSLRTESELSTSATVAEDGTITLSVVNTSLDEPAELDVRGGEITGGRLLTAEKVRDHNTFEEPDRIVPRPLEGTTVPPHSIAVLTLR